MNRRLEAGEVLLVEDDPNDVALVRRAFRRAGLEGEPRVVHDGEAASDYLEGAHRFADRAANPLPALVLLDLKLPRRSGLEVLERLRATPGLRRLPVVMLTSSGEMRDVDRAYDLGANAYLVKPVDPAELQEVVRHLGMFWLGANRRPSPGDP
jgi:CheY-like chemotaxis protein